MQAEYYGTVPKIVEGENAEKNPEDTEGEWTYQTDYSIVTDSQEQREQPPPV